MSALLKQRRLLSLIKRFANDDGDDCGDCFPASQSRLSFVVGCVCVCAIWLPAAKRRVKVEILARTVWRGVGASLSLGLRRRRRPRRLWRHSAQARSACKQSAIACTRTRVQHTASKTFELCFVVVKIVHASQTHTHTNVWWQRKARRAFVFVASWFFCVCYFGPTRYKV